MESNMRYFEILGKSSFLQLEVTEIGMQMTEQEFADYFETGLREVDKAEFEMLKIKYN